MMSAAVKKILTLLPAVPREIKERFGKEITYRQAYNLILNGQVSAKQKKRPTALVFCRMIGYPL